MRARIPGRGGLTVRNSAKRKADSGQSLWVLEVGGIHL